MKIAIKIGGFFGFMTITVCMLSLCHVLAVIYCYLKLCFIGGNLSFVSFMSCVSRAHLVVLASILFPSLVECFRILKAHWSPVGGLLTHLSACLVLSLCFVCLLTAAIGRRSVMDSGNERTEKARTQRLHLTVFQEGGYLGTWLSGGFGSGKFMVGLNLEGLF